MLETTPSFERIALNRVTFGARDRDVALVTRSGWSAWVDDQLAPPPGDDAEVAQHLAAQTMRIQYDAFDDNQSNYHWKAVDEDRPLNYLKAPAEQIWGIHRKIPWTVSFAERTRMETELVSGIYIRNAHSRYQLREFMADFWLNHFSVAKAKVTAAPLIAYDRDVIRPNVFGNFRTLLEAVTKSTSMLFYLDNALSTATIPNENYARELMELHTMGRDAYFGKNPSGADVSAKGFTDEDILQASRALSGWTAEYGQTGTRVGDAPDALINYPDTGRFAFNPYQHSNRAGRFLGYDLSALSGEAQGAKVLDLIANHPATAPFMCGKLCRRIFGDTPPQAVLDRAIAAWRNYRNAPNQIALVLRAILLEGPEIGAGPAAKMRRPYERFIAMIRTTDTVITAGQIQLLFNDLNDSPFIWPTPDGRPDTNQFWLSTYAHVTTWDYMKRLTDGVFKTSFAAQTPLSVQQSAAATVEYWVERMTGQRLNDEAMAALTALAAMTGRPGRYFSGENWEIDFTQRVIATISVAPEFVMR